MEKYEFDEEWAALEPFEKVDPAGSTSLLSGRVLLGVTASGRNSLIFGMRTESSGI